MSCACRFSDTMGLTGGLIFPRCGCRKRGFALPAPDTRGFLYADDGNDFGPAPGAVGGCCNKERAAAAAGHIQGTCAGPHRPRPSPPILHPSLQAELPPKPFELHSHLAHHLGPSRRGRRKHDGAVAYSAVQVPNSDHVVLIYVCY